MSGVITERTALQAGKSVFASAMAAARYVSLTGSATYEGGKYLPIGKPLLVGVEISERLAAARIAAKTADECGPAQAVGGSFERFQEECFELADQLAATASRVALLAGLFAELDDDGKDQAADLLASAYAPPAEFDTPEVMALMAHVAARRSGLLSLTEDGLISAARGEATSDDIVNTSDGASEASAADQVAATGAEASSTGSVDAPQPSDQAAGAEGASGGSDAGAPLTHTPPTEAGPSGDAVVDGASAPATAADPAEPAPAKPAAKSEGGAAKAKKPGG
ncbi:hypothetical protein D3C71_314520 [compost metagenome]